MESRSKASGIDLHATTFANDASSNSQPSEKLASAPEPPRWRFINEAKKSMGYSSLHAGTHVEGQSSNELGAKYVAPDISLYSPKEEKFQPKGVEYELPRNRSMAKEDIEVGKLDINVPPQNAFSNQNNEVGKLQINEASSNETQLPSGTFAGLQRFVSQRNESRKPFKEWDTNLRVGPKKEREQEWYDGKIHDSYTMPNSGISSKTHGEVGKLKFHGPGSEEETFIGEIPMSNKYRDDGGDSESEDIDGGIREGALFINRNGSTINEHEIEIDGSTVLTEDEDSKKKHRCLYLLLLLLLTLVVILAVLLGKRNGGVVPAATGTVGVLVVPPFVVVNETTVPSSYPSASLTNEPSLQPSTSSSMECPLGTKPFYINHVQSDRSLSDAVNDDATWKIKDACSGKTFAQCLPCPHGNAQRDNSFEQSQNNGAPTLRHFEKNLFNNITECLPINNEYVVQVLPLGDSESCCGFDPIASIILYDNVVLEYGAQDGGIIGSPSKSMHFGERETPCRSESPSLMPSITASSKPSLARSHVPSSGPSFTPSLGPSHIPSRSPSFTPTFAPTTSPPTKSPVIFLGGCPETYLPYSYYNIETQIESNGIIYKCISPSCGSNMFTPGSSSSSLWSDGWEIVGSCSGTMAPTSHPTSSPTRSPSPSPTASPTSQPSVRPKKSPSKEPIRVRTRHPTKRPTLLPTCSTEQEFNLCLAVDMSGSVCNGGTGAECVECQSTFLPIFFFLSECQDFFVSEDTCCNNFANVKEFSSLMVNLLGEFSAEKSFSVVQFATNAQLVSGLASADSTVPVIDQLDYTGGLTNHASAIQKCQQTLSYEGHRKNFIMLITDGVSSEPGFDPEGSAEAAATSAKSDGTFIIPIFISENNNLSALSFMRRLSSDGKVFDVTDFDSLNSLQDKLIDQVSCS